MSRRSSFVSAILFVLVLSSWTFGQEAWRSSRVDSGGGDLVSVHFTSSSTGWIAGDNGFLASTRDGGTTWTRVSLGITEDVNEIYFRNERDGYVVAGRKLFMTSDAGRTWRQITIFDQQEFGRNTPTFLSIRFGDKRRGLAIGSVISPENRVLESLVMRTDDGGSSWQRVLVPYKSELYHLGFSGNRRAWIAGDNGLIIHSRDGGLNWQIQQTGTREPLFAIEFRDSSYGFAVGREGTILRTESGGESWESIKPHFTDTLMRVAFTDDRNGWAVGHNGSVLRTSDHGRTWVREECEFDGHLYGLFTNRRMGWAVGKNGTIVQYTR
ncbi:MAG: hypothetical protein H0V76_02980 [Blastocatellia bacterium]|nr:hypothetical protein [Blastocatellia bacterium]